MIHVFDTKLKVVSPQRLDEIGTGVAKNILVRKTIQCSQKIVLTFIG